MTPPQHDKIKMGYYVVSIHELEPDLDENSFRKVLQLDEVKVLRETYYLITPEKSPSKRLSFGHTIVYPRGRTTGHAHPDLEEIYFYIQGRGEMQIDDDKFPVKEGDAVYIPAGSYHVTYNTGIIPIRFIWATFKLTNCVNNHDKNHEKIKVKKSSTHGKGKLEGIPLIHGTKYQPPEVINEVPVEEYAKLGLTREQLLQMFEKMLRIRRFEEAVERLFLVEGKLIGLCHPYFGMEAVAVGVISALRPDDPIISTHRNHGHAIARGVPFKDLMAELFGRSTGTCKGLGGSMHAALSVEHNIPVVTAIVGGGIPIACGIGLALQYRKEKRIAVVFFGDGAVNTGAFNEGLNLAAVWRLPILFVCENNYYALSTPFYKVCAGESIASRGAAYGIKSFLVPNANDVIAVYLAAMKAVDHISSGNGPAFIECRTYRMKGHGIYDTGWYRPKEEVEEWMKKDPIDIFMKRLKIMGILDDEILKRMEEDIEKEIEQAIDEAEKAPVLGFDELWGLLYVGGEARYGEWR